VRETGLAGVRGHALAKLPEAEREAWKKLWEDVNGLLVKVDSPWKNVPPGDGEAPGPP
jgi:hypothetical protein